MNTKAVFKRAGLTFVPASPEASEALMALKDGQKCMMTVRTPRWIEHHDKFWALCQVVAEAVDTTKDSVKDWILRKLNYVEPRYDPEGRLEFKIKSIAFESMAQDEFSRFYDAAVPRMAELLGTTRPEFIDRFNEIYNGREAA